MSDWTLSAEVASAGHFGTELFRAPVGESSTQLIDATKQI